MPRAAPDESVPLSSLAAAEPPPPTPDVDDDDGGGGPTVEDGTPVDVESGAATTVNRTAFRVERRVIAGIAKRYSSTAILSGPPK